MSSSQEESHLFFKRLSYNLLSIGLICVLLYVGRDIILPLLFSLLLATLLRPVENFLLSKKFPKVLAILLPLVLSLLAILGVLYFLSTQIVHFFDDWDTLKNRVNELVESIQKWVTRNLNMSQRTQEEYISETTEKVKTEAPKIAGRTFLSLTESITYVILLPIYTFLILFYKEIIRKFFVELFDQSNRSDVVGTLQACTKVSQRYITGLMIETTIVFSLNSIGFLILGIKYAIFLALFAALLNLIPYIGMLVANIMCIIITLITSNDPTDALWVAGILALVQFFDNNIGMPMIVGNNVRINALVTVFGVIVGGALCGVPGMFLAIPGLAVLKVIFDRVENLKAWGILLGDDTPVKQKKILGRKKKEEVNTKKADS